MNRSARAPDGSVFRERLRAGEASAMLQAAAMLGARIGERAPVRLVAVSGSLVRPEHRGRHDDIDFFVVAESGRIWQAFALCLWHGWRLARRLGLPRRYFCFNYLVDEAHPEEIEVDHPAQAAEFLRLVVLHGPDTYRRLLNVLGDRLRVAAPELYRTRLLELPASEETTGAPASPEGPERPRRTPVRPGTIIVAVFILLAKFMEWRRRRRAPDAIIYSGTRSIRSHFYRPEAAAGHAPAMIHTMDAAAEAFSRLAPRYEERISRSPANAHMRAIVREALAPLVRPGMRALDLGAGTGGDALWLARQGCHVTAVDIAPGMLAEAARRVAEAGLDDRVQVEWGDARHLESLERRYPRAFDLVLANFGPLNMAGDPRGWAPALQRMMRPGGWLVATVMNGRCLWELAFGRLTDRRDVAGRRRGPVRVPVEGRVLDVRLYDPRSLAAAVAGTFTARRVRGLCVLMPPPGMDGVVRGRPLLARALARLDRVAGRLPVLRALGDHFLVALQPDVDACEGGIRAYI